jgi:Ca2+-transporting ATPase
LNKLRVLARSTAEVKAMLVNGLMKDKNIVAMTGVGISDLKARENADVSMSLGNRMQSEVTKDHSDIVLLDDSIQSI